MPEIAEHVLTATQFHYSDQYLVRCSCGLQFTALNQAIRDLGAREHSDLLLARHPRGSHATILVRGWNGATSQHWAACSCGWRHVIERQPARRRTREQWRSLHTAELEQARRAAADHRAHVSPTAEQSRP